MNKTNLDTATPIQKGSFNLSLIEAHKILYESVAKRVIRTKISQIIKPNKEYDKKS